MSALPAHRPSPRNRKGWFQLKRKTMRKKRRAKLQALKLELRHRLHWSVPEVGNWLGKVLNGHYRYYAVPGN